MTKSTKIFFTVSILLITSVICFPKNIPHFITVAKDGSGDFKTITEALDSLPVFNYERRIIFIKNGKYEEKIRIDQDYITLRGEDREKTIIRFCQLRSDWDKNKDSIGPAVININGDDIIIENLTAENTQPEIGPHAFVVYGKGTRTIIQNCNMISKGADTVSLWDYKTGMYYHSNCYFEGAVDFVCPRGWCFIKDSEFYEVKQTAAVWHAGGYDINQKFVIKNSSFDGVEGFKLGRHHYEAQFFFIDCRFSKNMADVPIYHVTYEDTTRNQPCNWGERYFFQNCSHGGANYRWLEDNLFSVNGFIEPNNITPAWTFNFLWDPEFSSEPKVIKYKLGDGQLYLTFNEPVSVIGKPIIYDSENRFEYTSGGGQKTLNFECKPGIENVCLEKLTIVNEGKISGTIASVKERNCFNQ
ncbi:MAG: pectinesterase family protein [bacterium]